MSSRATQTYIPLVVFPALTALSLKFTLGNVFASGLPSHIEELCPDVFKSLELSPHRLSYIGSHAVDAALCRLVSFFHIAYTPAVLPLLNYFLATAIPLVAIPSFEGVRTGRPAILASPLIILLALQAFTFGAALPFFWLAFILTGAAQRRAPTSTVETPVSSAPIISSAHAQAVTFGLAVGAAVPSICLVVLRDSHVTALWQLFPLWQFLAQSAHLLARRPSAHSGSGLAWVRAFYIAAFIFASSTHLATLAGSRDLKALLVPSLTPRTNVPHELKVLDLFQWDFIFAYLSCLVGTLWFARTTKEAAFIALWNVIGSVAVGPGAAIAAVALWRESYLHDEVQAKSKAE